MQWMVSAVSVLMSKKKRLNLTKKNASAYVASSFSFRSGKETDDANRACEKSESLTAPLRVDTKSILRCNGWVKWIS